jgi:hypothetical protein
MPDTKPHPGPFVEGDGVSYRGIVWFVVLLAGTTIVCQILMFVMLRAFQYQSEAPALSPVAAAPVARPEAAGRVYPDVNAIGAATGPQPRLLVNEPSNLAEFRARENQVLTTYGWEDRNTGVVRIPVERAKDLLIQKGLPVRGAAAGAAASKDAKEVKEGKK